MKRMIGDDIRTRSSETSGSVWRQHKHRLQRLIVSDCSRNARLRQYAGFSSFSSITDDLRIQAWASTLYSEACAAIRPSWAQRGQAACRIFELVHPLEATSLGLLAAV